MAGSVPPSRKKIPAIERVMRPFTTFAQRESSSGIVLMVCAAIALIWANSPYQQSYFELWHLESSVEIGAWRLSHSLAHWINDGLMALFFLLVGLEIKRELLGGELSDLRQARLPLFAAVGGMIVPALIYAAINFGKPSIIAWGAPMATDIAFALGVLALLGNRIPSGLKVFLAALAIIDDIGSVLVIALFYTASINFAALGAAAACFAAMLIVNRMGVRNLVVYMLLFACLWLATLSSGVHATIAGVVAAIAIPARSRIDSKRFLDRSRSLLDDYEANQGDSPSSLLNEAQDSSLRELEILIGRAGTPLQRLEHTLHPLVAFGIMPIFALANAGVAISMSGFQAAITEPVTLGIVFGLVVGKLIGISLFAHLAVALKAAVLPEGVTWRHIHGVAMVGGIGFTMSLFVATLAFKSGPLLDDAKMAVILASLIAGILGCVALVGLKPRPESA